VVNCFGKGGVYMWSTVSPASDCLIPCTYLVNVEISYFLFCRHCAIHGEMFIQSVVSWTSVYTSRTPKSISVIITNRVKVRKSSCKVPVTCVRFNHNPNVSENLSELSRKPFRWELRCSVQRVERQDGRTDREAKSDFLNCFVYAPKIELSETEHRTD
jgi:hypothetical protein